MEARTTKRQKINFEADPRASMRRRKRNMGHESIRASLRLARPPSVHKESPQVIQGYGNGHDQTDSTLSFRQLPSNQCQSTMVGKCHAANPAELRAVES